MNPKEFSWADDQQVTVTNPTTETYRFKVHNKQYELGAGKTAKMPGYIAWVYVYGLSTQIAQADGVFNRWNEEGFRNTYYDKLVAGVDSVIQDVQEAPEEPEVYTFDEVESAPVQAPPAPPEAPVEAPSQPAPVVAHAKPKARALQSDKTRSA